MCGFAGRVNLGAPVDPHELSRMGDLLRHRGPDDGATYLAGSAGLVHRRLAIVDRASGRQPLSNEDGTIWIVFNGEIYNHESLRQGLEARGHRFRTRTDTEVIVHAYEDSGTDALHRLRGMFAFALWDEPRRHLFLARDRLGEKPLYYAIARGGHLLFASEAKALLASDDLDRSLDDEAIDAYLTLRYVPAPLTPWRSIRKLPPGSWLLWKGGSVLVEAYWDLCTAPETDLGARRTEALAASDLRDCIDDRVAERLMGEVPVGVFLSGGIDSTDVTASMVLARHGLPVVTYAVGYTGSRGDDELAYARLAARALDTDHHEVVVTDAAVRDALPRIVWHLDEPLADDACIPLYFLARSAKSTITVVLSGEGADEILAGYTTYRRQLALERTRAMLGSVVRPAGAALSRMRAPRLGHFGRLLLGPLEAAYHGVPRGIDPAIRWRLGRPDQGAVARLLAPHWEATRGLDPLRRMLYLDTKLWLPDDLLAKADRMTMASAVELRVPFLDHELVELAWSLPNDYKINGGVGKYLLRRAAEGRVPETILTRPKRGFPVPMARWLRSSLRELAYDVVAGLPELDAAGRRAAQALIAEHDRGLDHVDSIYPLLVIGLWHASLAKRGAE